MYDSAPEIVTKLTQATGLKVYYELVADSSITKPVITYMPANDYVHMNGNTLGYSVQQYYIKLWDNKRSTIVSKGKLIDNAMRESGFKRVSYRELVVDTQICAIWLYEGMAKEEFTTNNN